MNGLDFNASRRVEQHRKQFAGAGFQFLRLFLILRQSAVELVQFVFQFLFGSDRPAAQFFGNAGAHFHCRRFGISQAQQSAGVNACQQQPQNPVGKHFGFAGAGRGVDPDRKRRICRQALFGGSQLSQFSALLFG